MKQLSNKVTAGQQARDLTCHLQVSIVPVIAKSDCLTMVEIKKLKARILQEIAENGILIYSLPDVDSDEDEEYKIQVQSQEDDPHDETVSCRWLS